MMGAKAPQPAPEGPKPRPSPAPPPKYPQQGCRMRSCFSETLQRLDMLFAQLDGLMPDTEAFEGYRGETQAALDEFVHGLEESIIEIKHAKAGTEGGA